jgi:phosphoribosylformylglycinamidine synthase
MLREVRRETPVGKALDTKRIDPREAALRLLRLPTIADKGFLISIGDRSVGGMIARDQYVGPWQVPASDVAVTAAGYTTCAGEAMAMGERTPVAVLNAPASGRLAVTEAITNILAADIADIRKVRLSANWMAAAGWQSEDAALFDTVRAVGRELCSQLGLTIPVGKDSLSMKTAWNDHGEHREVVAPLSLIVSAFAPVRDVRRTLTPVLVNDEGTRLLLVDLGRGQHRLGGSCLAQVFNQTGAATPDLDDPELLAACFAAITELKEAGHLLAYHDRSDGGAFVTLAEMAFAGNCGVSVDLPAGHDGVAALFAEEPGVVVQVREDDLSAIEATFQRHGLGDCVHDIGTVTSERKLDIAAGGTRIQGELGEFKAAWCEVSREMQALRDNPECAAEEYHAKLDLDDPGLNASLTFDPAENPAAPYVGRGTKPAIAILREQGVNSHAEMAAAFDRAGFRALDVHMTDVLEGRVKLDDVKGLVACGGFSYGDVLGAGEGWAKSILYNGRARDDFAAFFAREDTFSLGVCNGCQMFATLKELIPGATHWPRFVRNRSEQFEGRTSLVEIVESPSIFFAGMQGSVLPLAVAHGEGRAEFASQEQIDALASDNGIAMRYVDNRHRATERYPANPNGSPYGITSVTSTDGRVTALMPHPERVFRTLLMSWHPEEWTEDSSPWMRMFANARRWLD